MMETVDLMSLLPRKISRPPAQSMVRVNLTLDAG